MSPFNEAIAVASAGCLFLDLFRWCGDTDVPFSVAASFSEERAGLCERGRVLS
jgi:hypothetical protein